MQRDKIKTIFAVIFTVYFLWCAYSPETVFFMHLVNTPIHEAGHLLFRPFGEFMGVAGGSLFQIIVPCVFFGYFLWHRKFFSASIVLFWVGENFLDVYVYANDAVVMQLPLLSGLTGSEGGFHDWNYLLTETGLLEKTPVIAKIIHFIGSLLIIIAGISAVVFARTDEKIFLDSEI